MPPPDPVQSGCSIGHVRVTEAGELLGIRVLDHVIVATRGAVSLPSRRLP